MIDAFLLRCSSWYMWCVCVEVMIDSFLLRCLGITLFLSLKYEYSHLHMFAHNNSNPFVAINQRKKTM